ncbi:MAG TPA: DinB family protein [Bryobacteraceae bacterium]|nr:DinB family protein [Bryobacteraceae bacterium]
MQTPCRVPKLCRFLIPSLMLAPALFADGVTQIYDGQVKSIEGDILRLAEAMPADKYDFAPSAGAFHGVRTYAQQVRHLATVIYMLAGAVLGERPPVDIGTDEDGPAAVRTKAQLVEYLRGSIAFAHKAMASLTQKNELDDITAPGGDGKIKRVEAASEIAWHSFDHYGQMVVYARMNGVIPPSSMPAPTPAKN